MTKLDFTQEAVAFQSDVFFKDLVRGVSLCRGQGRSLDNAQLGRSEPMRGLSETIRQHTGMAIDFRFMVERGMELGPSIVLPALHANHVFDTEAQRIHKEIHKVNKNSQIRQWAYMSQRYNSKALRGALNLSTGQVSGVFKVLRGQLLMPRSWMIEGLYPAEEVAAAILHEVGHQWSAFEMAARVASTNYCLAFLAQTLQEGVPQEDLEFVFKTVGEWEYLQLEEMETLRKSKNIEAFATVLIDASVRTAEKELGASPYDATGCEFLADQYATRYGAGRYLVLLKDRMRRNPGSYKYFGDRFVSATKFTVGIVGSLVIGAVGGGVWGALLWGGAAVAVTQKAIIGAAYMLNMVFGSNRDHTHDSDYSRFTRVKHQLIEQLKNRELAADIRDGAIEDIEVIDAILKNYKDNLGFFEKLAYVLRPGYRKQRKSELWQKDMEELAHNDLFLQAARLQRAAEQ